MVSQKSSQNMNNIVLFIDSGTFREDYARVYSAIYLELKSKDIIVTAILGPGASIEVEKRFEALNALSCDQSESIWHFSPIALVMYLNALKRKMITFPKRKPWQIITKFRNFLVCVKLLEKVKPSALLSIKFDSFYELVSAANMMEIPSVAIQHGEDYFPPPGSLRYHEWPASTLLVWSAFWADFHEKRFPNQAIYHSIDSVLWHARYFEKTKKFGKYIVIFESNERFDHLFDQLLRSSLRDLIKIKPHPWRLDNDCSYAQSNFPTLLYNEQLWNSAPQLGISFGSTITNELIYNDCPCVTICLEAQEIGMIYPVTGSFLMIQPIKNLVEIVRRLMNDQTFYNDFLKLQKEESVRYMKDTKPAERISEYMAKLVEM